jgi:hypothetical protein
METKLHTLPTTLKVVMLQTPPMITNTSTTSKAKQTMCISFTNEGKTQVGWPTKIGKKKRKNELMQITLLSKDPPIMYHIQMK